MERWVDELKRRVLHEGEIDFGEAVRLIGIEDREALDDLIESAGEITGAFHSREPKLCSLVNAKSYLCKEDCKFCSQSAHFETGVERYPLMHPDEVVRVAKGFEKNGVRCFCVVTSGGELSDREFDQVIGIYQRLRRETALVLDGCLGFLTAERVRRLKAAGVSRINSNLQSSKEFYPHIVKTHTYELRLEALRILKEEGMEICAGGILNLGESRLDRVKMAFELKPFEPHCIPVNILNPRPGTPLENQPPMDAFEILKTIAVFRFVHPRAVIKLAGGRDINLSLQDQQRALRGGANGLIVGGYLTTRGNPLAQDLGMLKRCGFKVPDETDIFTAGVSA